MLGYWGMAGKWLLVCASFLMQIVNSFLHFILSGFFVFCLCQLLFFCLLAKLKAKQLHSYAQTAIKNFILAFFLALRRLFSTQKYFQFLIIVAYMSGILNQLNQKCQPSTAAIANKMCLRKAQKADCKVDKRWRCRWWSCCM